MNDGKNIKPQEPKMDSVNRQCGFVALVGRTSSGKSTLMNRWVGELIAIVSPKTQTTRRRLHGILNRDQAQVVFVDTPGFHKPMTALNRRMLAIAREALTGTEVILYLVDANRRWSDDDQRLAEEVARASAPVFVLLNKIDKVKSKESLLPKIRDLSDLGFEAIIPVSVLSGDGLDLVLEKVIELLPERPWMFPEDWTTDQPERYMIAEIIREAVLFNIHEEVPHGCGVLIESYEDKDRVVVVEAAILVDKESQKPILLGKGGQMIKAIGIRARKHLEKRLNVTFHVKLFIRVEKDWREKESLIQQTENP